MSVHEDPSAMCTENATLMDPVYRHIFFDMADVFTGYHPWIMSAIGSFIVGLSGIFPLLVIPIDEGANLKTGAGARTLKVLLSFAVGGLLGDVFLHLLPEAWAGSQNADGSSHPSMAVGLWVLAGMLLFTILEKVFTFDEAELEAADEPKAMTSTSATTPSALANGVCAKRPERNNNSVSKGKDPGDATHANGHCVSRTSSATRLPVATGDSVDAEPKPRKTGGKQVAGYLNLMANSIDNFTHGLAVGGSFLISFRIGVLSTFAILVHEIPHEVGDFAILLRAGFSRWEAARAQLFTASAGLIGAMVAVAFSEASGSIESGTSWILPFTAGGFLHIALVTVLPELLQERSPWESFKQMSSLFAGIGVMAGMTALVE